MHLFSAFITITPDTEQRVVKGQDLTLTCTTNLDARERAIQWYKDDNQLEPLGVTSVFEDDNIISVLEITNVKEVNEGTYKCKVQNKDLELETTGVSIKLGGQYLMFS